MKKLVSCIRTERFDTDEHKSLKIGIREYHPFISKTRQQRI